MSNQLQVATLSDAVISAVTTAWKNNSIVALSGLIIAEDDNGPRVEQPLPLATVSCEEIEVSLNGPFASMSCTSQQYNFEIILTFAMPAAAGTASGKVARVKASLANALIAQLQAGATFAGIASFPLVHKISFHERVKRYEGAAQFRCMFSCYVQATHH